MARRLLGKHRPFGFMLAPRRRPRGRDNLQPQPSTRSATSAQVTSAQTHWHRTMAKPPSQTEFLSRPNASYRRHLEATRTPVYNLLLPQLCLDHRRECDCLHLADFNLQIHTIQSGYVHSL